MNRLSDPELWEYIRGDVPYFDLTTHLLALPPQQGTLKVLTRRAGRALRSDEVFRRERVKVPISQDRGEVLEEILIDVPEAQPDSLRFGQGEGKSVEEAMPVCTARASHEAL